MCVQLGAEGVGVEESRGGWRRRREGSILGRGD